MCLVGEGFETQRGEVSLIQIKAKLDFPQTL